MSAFGYEVPDGYTLKSVSAENLKAGMLVLISINAKTDFDRVASATLFVRPCPCPKIHDSSKVMDVFYTGSNWHKTYALTDRVMVAVPA
jgi:hypothetical protein